MPELLTPPNGRSGALLTVVLMPTMPTSSRSATSSAGSTSPVNTALPSPYGESLASFDGRVDRSTR